MFSVKFELTLKCGVSMCYSVYFIRLEYMTRAKPLGAEPNNWEQLGAFWLLLKSCASGNDYRNEENKELVDTSTVQKAVSYTHLTLPTIYSV